MLLGRLCMEIAFLQFHPLRRILPYTSPLANHTSPIPHPTFAATEILSSRRQRSKIAAVANTRQSRAFTLKTTPFMADEAPPKNSAAAAATTPPSESETTLNESEKSPPPPPEKPLPGDCCGSGCVRCVWDVYYEELEEYNKLYKIDSDPKSKP